MDLATLLNALTGLQQTIEIAKALRGVDARLNDAEYKARIADLIEGLLSAREALSDAKMSIQDMKETIRVLEKKLAERGRYRDRDGNLFQIGDDGNEIGEPYCNHCYVKEEKLYRLKFVKAFAGWDDGFTSASSDVAHYSCNNCHLRTEIN